MQLKTLFLPYMIIGIDMIQPHGYLHATLVISALAVYLM